MQYRKNKNSSFFANFVEVISVLANDVMFLIFFFFSWTNYTIVNW